MEVVFNTFCLKKDKSFHSKGMEAGGYPGSLIHYSDKSWYW